MVSRFIKVSISSAFILLLANIPFSSAQQLSALEGSIYGGALNTSVQPAAAANLPYRWDVEVAGASLFWNNNIVATSPLFWRTGGDSPAFSGHFITGGGKRWGDLHADVHILNFLLRLPWTEGSWMQRKRLVLGAGMNLHSQTFFDRLDYVYADSMKTMSSFLGANALNRFNRGRAVDQQWMEWYATAAVILRDDAFERLIAGATLKLAKGVGAAVIDLQGVSVGVDKMPDGKTGLVFTSARARYGYSENLEEFPENPGFRDVSNTLVGGSPLSPALSIGFSYMRQRPVYIAGMKNDNPAHYDWKVEIALTDLGRLKYPLGSQSRLVSGPKTNVKVRDFSRMVDHVSSLNDFNDSAQNIAHIKSWDRAVSISLPTALRINVDKYFGKNLYLNARAVLDASFLNAGADYKMHQLNYLMVTPRWEIKRLGVYAPLYINAHGSTMIGAALRLGPLVVGVHDFGWFFRDTPTGGAYLALVIRSLPKKPDDCPSF